MTRFDDLDRALTAYFDIEAAAPAPAGLLESAMTTTSRRRPRPAWHARLRAGSIPAPRGETARTLLIAAALVGLLLLIVGFAVLGGGRNPNPLVADGSALPSDAASPPAAAADAPVEDALRATWLGITGTLPSLGNGSGPVGLAISSDGRHLAASNFGAGATFDSTISLTGPDRIRMVLDREGRDCAAGAVGEYRWAAADRWSLLTLTEVADDCVSRGEALSRTWGRSLVEPTTKGSGFVDTMGTLWSVSLPDQALSTRTLDDMIEIGGSNGFSLMAFLNPQGFVDPCSDQEERVPYTPGAEAFADFLQDNPALDTIRREALTIGGNDAIHIVTAEKRPLPCAKVPQDGLYLWTPKDCQCHFVGGHDSLYLIDLPNGDTLMLEVSPVDENAPIERQIIDSIQVPARLPDG